MDNITEFCRVSRTVAAAFKDHRENRNIDRKYLRELKRSILTNEDGFNSVPSISVNKLSNTILNGKSRRVAFLELIDEGKIPPNSTISVEFMSIPLDKEREYLSKMNKARNWNINTHFESKKINNEHLKNLEEWAYRHELCVVRQKNGTVNIRPTYAVAFVKKRKANDQIENDTFKIYPGELELATIVHNELLSILNFLDKKVHLSYLINIITSWYDYRDRHSMKEWMKGFKSVRAEILKRPFHKKTDWDCNFAYVSDRISNNI